MAGAALVLASPWITISALAQTITTYDQPCEPGAPTTCMLPSDKFTVEVAPQGSSSYDASFTYQTTDQQNSALGARNNSYTTFTFSGGPITVKVTKLGGVGISAAVIRPLGFGITPVISADTRSLTFTLDRPRKLSVEINPESTGNVVNRLFVFADPPEVDVPSPTASNVLYFGPGLHTLTDNCFLYDYAVPYPEHEKDPGYCPAAGKTIVYIAGGAVVRGLIRGNGISNFTIRGRGILSGRAKPHVDGPGALSFYGMAGVKIDGITLVDSPGWFMNFRNANSATAVNDIKNLKMIGWYPNTDGIHTGNHMVADDIFIFNRDDALITSATTTLKATNLTIWAQQSAAIQLCWNCVAPRDPAKVNILVSGVHVIHTSVPVIRAKYGGSLLLHSQLIENVRAEDHTDNTSNQRFLQLEIAPNSYCNMPECYPHGDIEKILLKNITIDYTTADNIIYGENTTSDIHNITFENLRVAGNLITSAAGANIATNSYASNIAFIPTQLKTAFDNLTGWIATGTGGASAPVITTVSGHSGNVVRLADNSTSDGKSLLNYTLPTGLIQYSSARFSFMQQTKNDGFYVTMRQGTTVAPAMKTINGDLVWVDTAGTNHVVIDNYSANSWYNIRLAPNPLADSYAIFVNDVLIEAAATFRSAVTTLDNIEIGTSQAVSGTTYVDDVDI